ncbi:PD-(D/E)XK nuclease family protein, partial [Myxococcota bacterium]|nr:PD-(D/E)XK nuclease family protein [Myxococcota bacterium]
MGKERTELAEMLGNLLADELFFKLDRRLSSPNMFSILKMEYQKSNYNSLLAYLLNPHENHGMEDRFLRLFLARSLDSRSLEENIPTEGLSPIPYERVQEAILDWDRLDVLSADLRETVVFTDYPLGDEGRTVDIAIWNEQYGFALYVENLVAPKEGWRRYHGGERRVIKSHSQEYLLDLYRQWASEDAATQYQILPVFISMGDMIPDERYLTRILKYDWMGDALARYLQEPTLSSHSQILMKDFIEHLQRELPRSLDKDLYNDLSTISDLYGPVISRLHDHVVECSGCENEDELIVAFHDIYRRHRECMDALWLFTDSMEFSIIKEVEKEIRGMEFDDQLVIINTGSTLSGFSSKWMKPPRDGKI